MSTTKNAGAARKAKAQDQMKALKAQMAQLLGSMGLAPEALPEPLPTLNSSEA